MLTHESLVRTIRHQRSFGETGSHHFGREPRRRRRIPEPVREETEVPAQVWDDDLSCFVEPVAFPGRRYHWGRNGKILAYSLVERKYVFIDPRGRMKKAR